MNDNERDVAHSVRLERDRLAGELTALRDALAEAQAELEMERGVLAMTVARLGGTVEGHPTHRINFLQRIDELRDLEARLSERMSQREAYQRGHAAGEKAGADRERERCAKIADAFPAHADCSDWKEPCFSHRIAAAIRQQPSGGQQEGGKGNDSV